MLASSISLSKDKRRLLNIEYQRYSAILNGSSCRFHIFFFSLYRVYPASNCFLLSRFHYEETFTKLRHTAALSSTTPSDRSVECVKGPSWSVVFPRGYIAGRRLSKPVVLNLDNNGWVKSNSAGNFIEIYRQTLRGELGIRPSKYGYKSDLNNSMTRRPKHCTFFYRGIKKFFFFFLNLD